MEIFKLGYLLVVLVALTASMCNSSDNSDKIPTRNTLKIALTDSLSVDEEDDKRHLPDEIRTLCEIIMSESKDCNRAFILDPTISRLDLERDFSLKTAIEKGGSKDVNNPKVIGRLIKKHLEDVNVPKEFTKPSLTKDSDQLFRTLLSTKAARDSIFILSTNGLLDNYIINSKKYKVYSSFEEIRDQINVVLCQDPKASLALLVNPPLQETKVKISKSENSTPISRTTIAVNKISKKREIISGSRTQSDNGDLTIIKGSEGCDICTRYYSARDNLGRVRQVTQRNSTECCPCGKTIEMRGRTYRMECEGVGINRLSLVE